MSHNVRASSAVVWHEAVKYARLPTGAERRQGCATDLRCQTIADMRC